MGDMDDIKGKITANAAKVHFDVVALSMTQLDLDEMLECFAASDEQIAQAIRVAQTSLIQRPWFSQQALVQAVRTYRETHLMADLRKLVAKGGKAKAVSTADIVNELRQAQMELAEAARVLRELASFPRLSGLYDEASERVCKFTDRLEGKQ